MQEGRPDESEAKLLKPFAPNCLRHTALTNVAPLCDTFTLKTIAGHSQISMTARYVHPQGEVIAKAFRKSRTSNLVIGASHCASSQDVGDPRRGGFKCWLKELNGEPQRNRTSNLLIKSQLLCQLS